MSRAAVRNLVLPLLVAAALLAPATASAAPGAAVFAPAGFEMTRSIQLSFKRLQELWLQWLGASLQDNPARAGETLRSLPGAPSTPPRRSTPAGRTSPLPPRESPGSRATSSEPSRTWPADSPGCSRFRSDRR